MSRDESHDDDRYERHDGHDNEREDDRYGDGRDSDRYVRYSDDQDGYRFTLVNGQVTGLQQYDDGRWRTERMDRNETWRFDGTNLIQEEAKRYGVETSVYADSNGDGIFVKVSESYGYRAGSVNTGSLRLGGGDDRWEGDDRDEHIYGEDGKDRLYGGGGADIIEGGLGDDELYGGRGADLLTGGIGNDLIRAGNGADELIGGAGADQLWGGLGTNTVRAGLNDAAADAIYVAADSIINPLGNPNSVMRDLLLELDGSDRIFISGVDDGSLTFGAGVMDPLGSGQSGIGIYANGSLEALVVGAFSVDQVNSMTTGIF